mgnify:CR=1 FL=1
MTPQPGVDLAKKPVRRSDRGRFRRSRRHEMLGKKKKEEEEVRAFLGKGAEFTGKLIFNGSVRIDGDF